MPIEFADGDIFDFEVDALAHGCNARGFMGAGIAAQFRDKYPAMYHAYKRLCDKGAFGLGSIFIWGGKPTVYNLGTQFEPGANASLNGIRWSVERMLHDAETWDIKSIATPQIGAGIGGLDWLDVSDILTKLAGRSTVHLIAVTYVPNKVNT